MTDVEDGPGTGPLGLTDEHSLMLWQACAYADDVIAAAGSRRPLTPALDALLAFLHHRLLPYLGAEERRLPDGELRDEHLAAVLLADHDRIRAGVDLVERSRSRRLVALAVGALVDRLSRHVEREETWVTDGSHPWAAVAR